jgi:hypothetical protein
VEADRLFRAQTPFGSKSLFEVAGGEGPKRGIPGGAFAGRLFGWGGDVPAFDDLANEAVFEQAFPVCAAQLFGADGNNMLILKCF